MKESNTEKKIWIQIELKDVLDQGLLCQIKDCEQLATYVRDNFFEGAPQVLLCDGCAKDAARRGYTGVRRFLQNTETDNDNLSIDSDGSRFVVCVDGMDGDIYSDSVAMTSAVNYAFSNGANKVFVQREERQKVKNNTPDSEGLWRCECDDGTTYECEIYRLPTDALCAWGEDCNRSNVDKTLVWADDEWLGHIPVHCLADDGAWSLVETK